MLIITMTTTIITMIWISMQQLDLVEVKNEENKRDEMKLIR